MLKERLNTNTHHCLKCIPVMFKDEGQHPKVDFIMFGLAREPIEFPFVKIRANT